MQAAFRLWVLFAVLSTNIWANTPTSYWYTLGADKKAVINVELFMSSTCPHCHKADEFFRKIEKQLPWLHVTRFVINDDKNALIRFNQLLLEQNMDDFAVPSFFFCNTRWVGFASAESTGKDLLYALNYCKQQIEKDSTLTATTEGVLKRWANANLFDSNMTENPSALRYITVVSLMDAYNPCALFGLAAFFAFLFLQENRKGQLVAGSLFILAVALIHYLQQAYTSTFFELLPWFRFPAALVGIFAFSIAWQQFRRKASYYLLFLLTFLLALMIESYQQTCVMNWSYVFEQWLFNQHLSKAHEALYELAYQCMYVVPLVLTLVLYVILIKGDRFALYKQHLTTIALLFMMIVSLFLIIYPAALSSLPLSLLIIVATCVGGWFLNKFNVIQKIEK